MDCQHPRAALAQAGFPLCLNDFCPGTQSPREKKKKPNKKTTKKQVLDTRYTRYKLMVGGVLQDPSLLRECTFVPVWLDGGTEGYRKGTIQHDTE